MSSLKGVLAKKRVLKLQLTKLKKMSNAGLEVSDYELAFEARDNRYF